MSRTCTPVAGKGLVHLWRGGCGIGGLYKDSDDPTVTCQLCIRYDAYTQMGVWRRHGTVRGMLARYGDVIAGQCDHLDYKGRTST